MQKLFPEEIRGRSGADRTDRSRRPSRKKQIMCVGEVAMGPEQEVFFEKLYREHFREIEVYAFRYMKNWTDAEAVAQEAFHIACKKIGTVMQSENPMGWMKLTAKNVAREMIKKQQRQMALFVSIEELTREIADPRSAEEPAKEILEVCASAVSPEEFRLFYRVVVEGVPGKEAAKAEGISVWACYKRIERTEKKLREMLKKELGDGR